MLAGYENKQPYFEVLLIERLREYLSRSFLKRDTTSFNSASVAVTSSSLYFSGLFESRTHLLDVTSELGSLVSAVSCKDPHVSCVITLVDGHFILNPLIVKILCDHVRRTGTVLSYRVYSFTGSLLFSCDNIINLYYTPDIMVLDKISSWEPRVNKIAVDPSVALDKQLYDCAIAGLETHFSSTSSSCYGAAVLVDGFIYFGGVYSCFDKRLNLHAEMSAALCAFVDSRYAISHVAVVSHKFVDTVTLMCGCCRQFFSEIVLKTGVPITVFCFSYDGSHVLTLPLNDLLPYVWNSGDSAGKI